MRYRLLLLMFFLGILDYGCQKRSDEIPEVELSRDSSIFQLSDSSFFSDVRSIFYYDNKYFLADYKRDQIIELDDKLSLIKTLGRKGRGPGEFLGVSHLYVRNDTIFATNDGKKTIEMFSSDEYLSTISLPPNLRLYSEYRFVENDSQLYLTLPNERSSICAYKYISKGSMSFGQIKSYKTNKKTVIKNKRQLHLYKNYLIAISDCYPTVELYDVEDNNRFVNSYDLGNIKIVDNLLSFVEKNKLGGNSYYQIVSDSYVDNNMIYVLMLTVAEDGKLCSNKILQLEISNNCVKPLYVLSLGEGWFNSLCVVKSKVLAYNHSIGQLVCFSYENN